MRVDGEGKALRVDPSRQRHVFGITSALREGSLGAVFVRLRFGQQGLVAEPLGVVLGSGASRLVRLTA